MDADPSFRMDDQAEVGGVLAGSGCSSVDFHMSRAHLLSCAKMQCQDDLVLLREPRRRLGARRAAPQPAARTRPGVSQPLGGGFTESVEHAP